ncbi:MAG TPA: toxin-antitoxin system protein [bacterium]|nr:toxin-antitoxin system protein [bacterium]
MANSSIVRINNETKRTLEELSRKSGEPMLNVIDRAIEEYRRRVFLEETNAAYAKLKNDGKASGEYDRETAEWDSTLMDGLEDLESWEEGGKQGAGKKGRKPNDKSRAR